MIEYLPLKRITAMHNDEIHQAIDSVVNGGWYLKGKCTQSFEAHYAKYIGTSHCIGVGNGLDALTLILHAYKELGMIHEGDEIIVPANTFIATLLSITENGLTPVLVEPRIDTYQIDDRLIEAAITPHTKAIMVVHLYGRCAWTPLIDRLCRQYHLLLLEDNAQAHGCHALPDKTKRTGSLGHAAAHSFYPGKNLGAFGDAGAVTTNDALLAETIRSIANYGSSQKYVFDYTGRNSRLDELQAAVLDVKLKYLDSDNNRRQQIADRYLCEVDNSQIVLPLFKESVWHIFPVLCQRRDELKQFLKEHNVGTMIHYPIPPHHQKCYDNWSHLHLPVTERIHREELSLPCHQAMTDDEVTSTIHFLNLFR